MGDSASWFEVWVIGTVDLATLSLVALVSAHLSGGLSGALAGLGTVPGLLLFGYLWFLVVAAVWWVLRDGGLREERAIRTLIVRSAGGGALAGGGLIGGVALVAGIAVVVTDAASLTAVALIATIGGVAAGIVGAIVGVVFAAINVALQWVSERAVPTAEREDYSSSSSS
ncbi:hypothetical protein [Halobellus captivus]|uniref:hypothetical protein n=1 Tax=Halobellus captivus TaxID=2592614 RepID=UPI0011A2FB2C|nr:hypothetical protein [Halobellus captivus]